MTYDQIIQVQRSYFNTNATKSVANRIKTLKTLRALIKNNEAKLNEAIYKDFGKSEFETYATELSLIYHEINLFIKKLKKWSKPKRVSSGLANWPAKSYIIPEPLGVCLVIGAWNYPIQLSLLPAITAIAAGNTAIIKPSELTPHTSSVLATLINDNFDPKLIHIVTGGVTETTALLAQQFDKIFFTGSTTVGKIIYQAAAKHLTPVTLELGGKSPAIILPDTDLKVTAKRLVWAKYLNAGQTCVAPDYLLVHHSIKDQLLAEMATIIQRDYPTDGTISDNYLQIVNTKNYERLCRLIPKDNIYIGGITNDENRVISPTIVDQVQPSDPLMEDEIFGPILPVLTYDQLDEAIALVKARPKPLSCYVYGKNKKAIQQVLHELSFGGGCVNDSIMHLSNHNLPFGGVGTSGMGAYHGKAGFDTFTHYKSILRKPFKFEPNVKYAPYSPFKLKLIKRLLG